MDNKYYAIYEQIGNFAHMVYVSDSFYTIQDYLQDRFDNSNCDDESLFYSYFSIVEM